MNFNIKKENVCILCLTVADNELLQVIDENMKDMFGVLLIKLVWDESKDSFVCKDCTETVKTCFYFKLTCTETEEIFSRNAKENQGNLDLTDIYVDRKGCEGTNVCRFCLNVLQACNFVTLDTLLNEIAYLAELLPTYMPQIDFSIVKNPAVCESCKENLECYLRFMQKCFHTEGKQQIYCQDQMINSTDKHILGNHPIELVKVEQAFKMQNEGIPSENNSDVDQDKLHDINNGLIKVKEEFDNNDEIDLNKISYKITMNNPLKGRMYHCGKCSYETRLKNRMVRHTVTHQGMLEATIYRCPSCSFGTKQKYYLKNHMLLHKNPSEVVMYKCEMCSYESKHKHNLQKHLVTHYGSSKPQDSIKTYTCATCAYETIYKETFRRHVLVHRNPSEVEMQKCDLCTFQTKYKRCLKRHMLIHMDASQLQMYKCATCTYETRDKECLKIHVLVHKRSSEVELHKCELCAYSTKYKKEVKRHMLIHK